MHLLIVEDETPVADQLKQLLEQEHYQCDVSYNYKDALEQIDQKDLTSFYLTGICLMVMVSPYSL